MKNISLAVTAFGLSALLMVTAVQADSLSGSQQFLNDALTSDTVVVAASRLALQKGESEDVDDFALKMIKAHASNLEHERALLGDGIPMFSSDVDASRREQLAALEKLSGPAFDKAYMELMISDRQATSARFTKASLNAADPRIKNFVSETLPATTLESQTASEVYKRVFAAR